jgi:hypothetical protein
MNEFDKVAVLGNEVEAQLVDAALTDREIPHVMVSYHSIAYDGIFQVSKGWGHVAAPPEFRDEIRSIIEDIDSGSAEATG